MKQKRHSPNIEELPKKALSIAILGMIQLKLYHAQKNFIPADDVVNIFSKERNNYFQL